jgi:hypothetical protein
MQRRFSQIGRLAHHARRQLLALAALMLACGALVGWLATNQALQADLVDLVRATFGPEAAARLETAAFQTQDALRSARYRATGQGDALAWAAPAPPPAPAGAAAHAQSAPVPPPAPAAPPRAVGSTTVAWTPFVYGADGQPLLERALVWPDPERPYVSAALVRMDMQRLRLHLVPGTEEPASPLRVPRPGVIPAADRLGGALVAAFNGGFKAVNGHYGMMVDGVTFLPPQDGLATLAIYRDGHVRIGVWGQDMHQTPDMVAYRQNCPLLLDHGALTPAALVYDPRAPWGKTVSGSVTTWRSGLGLSADGRYLIYAVGDGLTLPPLGQALAAGGAERGMQLDINSFWTRFVTFVPTRPGQPPAAQKLLASMQGGPRQFITPDTRDFFYVTALR